MFWPSPLYWFKGLTGRHITVARMSAAISVAGKQRRRPLAALIRILARTKIKYEFIIMINSSSNNGRVKRGQRKKSDWPRRDQNTFLSFYTTAWARNFTRFPIGTILSLAVSGFSCSVQCNHIRTQAAIVVESMRCSWKSPVIIQLVGLSEASSFRAPASTLPVKL